MGCINDPKWISKWMKMISLLVGLPHCAVVHIIGHKCVCVSSIHTIYINIYIYIHSKSIYIYRHRFTRFTYINYDYWWLISIIVSRHRRLWLSHPSERGVQFPQSHGGVEAPTLGNGSMPGYSFLEWKLYTYMIIYIYICICIIIYLKIYHIILGAVW